MSAVLALALRCQALSRGTVPRAVPVGPPSIAGQPGHLGQMGQLGRAGQSQLLRPIAARSICTPSRSGRRRPIACRPAISTPGRDCSASGLGRSLGSCFFAQRAMAGRRRLAGLLRRTGGHCQVRRRSPAPGGRGRCLRLLRRRMARPRSGTLVADRRLRCGEAEQDHDQLLPFGTERTRHTWLLSRRWSAWYAARQAEVVAALEAMENATPVGFPNDFDKNGGRVMGGFGSGRPAAAARSKPVVQST